MKDNAIYNALLPRSHVSVLTMNVRGRRHHQYRHISNRRYPPPRHRQRRRVDRLRGPVVPLVFPPVEEEEEKKAEVEE